MPGTPSPSPAPAATTLAIWANDGGEKIPQDDTGRKKLSLAWDGKKIRLRAARNEVVDFQLIAENYAPPAGMLSTLADSFIGLFVDLGYEPPKVSLPGFAPEVFTVKYLQIKGVSGDGFPYNGTYDERHVPKDCRRPFTAPAAGRPAVGQGQWADRPCHDKFYPDPMVPATKPVQIASGKSQAFWVETYVPRGMNPGLYTGTVTFDGQVIPVELNVSALTLPDQPYVKTMLALGNEWSEPYAAPDMALRNEHFKLAKKHKITLVDATVNTAPPSLEVQDRLSGRMYTSGLGAGVGDNIALIGLYRSWNWQSSIPTRAKEWTDWCKANAPQAECVLQIIDEGSSAQYNSEAGQAKTAGLDSMATISPPTAIGAMSNISVVASWFQIAPPTWGPAIDQLRAAGRKLWSYNGKRPLTPSFAIEDDGIALRALPWAQIKMGVLRHFFWNATYYRDFQAGRGPTDVWKTAATFSGAIQPDPIYGERGWNYSNGDGLMIYPGMDIRFNSSAAPGIKAPMPSYRMKQWRRGIQDGDYYALAAAKDPAAAKAVLARMVPKVYWEVGVTNPSDPTYVYTDISWTTDPDLWESAKRELETIALR